MNYKNKYTLLLLVVAMAFTACTNLDESALKITNETSSIIVSETFLTDLGKFTTKNVLGDQVWTPDSRGYAGMSGYVVATRAMYANEDWLISPEIDLSSVTKAYVSFDYVAHLMGDITTESTIWVSENYVNDSLPAKATWTKLPVTLLNDPGSYVFLNSGQVSLNDYAGKKIKIGFKYISSATKAGTWEVKNFLVAKGEAYNKDYGSGLVKTPYTVAGAIRSTGLAWVKGYIVGYINTLSANAPGFTATGCNVKTNVLIADSANGVYLSRCIAVDLSNTVIQNGLNLVTNPANLGKQVKLYGQIGTYLSLPGLISASYFEFSDGTSGGVLPPDPIFTEKFTSGSFGLFTTQNVLGDQVWHYDASYGAYMTGFVTPNNYANEDWLISPQIDLTNINNAFLTFDHAARYFNNPATDITIWISENYVDGLPSTATWTQLPTSFVNASNWTFVNAGKFSLAGYANKKIKIALKYVSGTKAGTWEVKNFMVYK